VAGVVAAAGGIESDSKRLTRALVDLGRVNCDTVVGGEAEGDKYVE
jgi:hypothetical protein